MKQYLLLLCAAVAVSFISTFSISAQHSSNSKIQKTPNIKAPAAPLETFSGSINVGVGETITSLTNPGGLFERMNGGTVSGNVIVNITSDLTSETGTVVLNQQNETGPNGYTILIRPSGGPRVIEGRGFPALINFSGADRVTINGTLSGGKALTFRNTGWYGGAAIAFTGEAVDNSVTGCVIESTGELLSIGVVTIEAGNQGSNISIVGNTIRGWEPGPTYEGPSLNGPRVLVAVGGGANMIVANNELSRYGKTWGGYGVYAGGTRDLTISGNTIFGNGPNPGSLVAIEVDEATGNNVISRNVIRDHFTYDFVGFWVAQNRGTIEISGNRVYNINNACSSSGCGNARFGGMVIQGDAPQALVKVKNNMISYDPSTPNQWTMTGIFDGRLAGTLELLHNTIVMSGAASQWHSWGFRRGVNSAVNVSMFGNIFFNDRTGGGSSFAVGDQSNGVGSWESDYNLYIGAGETSQSYFDMGTDSFGTPVDFAAWKAGFSRDAHSITGLAETGLFTAQNLFVSSENLHLNNLENNPAVNAASGSGLAVDFDGQIRPSGGAPDIGADEAGAETAPTRTLSGRLTTAAGRGISRTRVTIKGGGLSEPVTLLTSAFGYFSFDGLRSDEVYLITVDAKRYLFANPNRVLSFVDSDTTVSFTAEP